jgi:HAD superfamily hydrolase (TIGR01509 family)
MPGGDASQRSSPGSWSGSSAPGRFELLILDCDGVLVDSERIVARLMAEVLAEHGHALGPDEILARYIGHSGPTGRRLLEADLGQALPDSVFQTLRERTATAFARELRPVDGVVAALDAIAIPQCVATNGGRDKMEASLEATGLASRFRGRSFSASEVRHGKPAPDLLLLAAATMGTAPARCAVVDDTVVGVRAGVAAGMTVFGYAASSAHVPALTAAGAIAFGRMSELPALLGGGGLEPPTSGSDVVPRG